MASSIRVLIRRSVFKKQIVAVTGLLLVLFIIFHLAGNLLILGGRDGFNHYSELLHTIPELLWVLRLGLIGAFVLHVYFTILVWMENRAARDHRYEVYPNQGETNWVRRTMLYSGILVFVFLFLHLYDFTIQGKEGPNTIVAGVADDASLGLYGLVWNSFLSFWRSAIYVLAVCAVGAHLSHAIQSMFQTVGFNHERYTPAIKKASIVLGIVVAVGFSSIPLYVLIVRTPSL